MISPHLDDAVLSCARTIAAYPGSEVVTVFASGPSTVDPLPGWDRASRYFRDGDDVLGIRRSEDRRAAKVLGADVCHLEFWDGQYRQPRYGYVGPNDDELASAVALRLVEHAQLAGVDAWLLPLGLGHDDHRLVSTASLALARATQVPVYVYEELPYNGEERAEVGERRLQIERCHFQIREDLGLRAEGDTARKRAAVRCHESQRRSLGRRAKSAVRGQERVYGLERL